MTCVVIINGHFSHDFGAFDVNYIDLSDNEPCGDNTLLLSTFVPLSSECSTLQKNLTNLLSLVVVMFKCCMVKHIQHEHSEEMKRKSCLVST